MPSRRRLLAALGAVAAAGCSDDRLDAGESGPEEMSVELPAFEATIPAEYTCDGANVSPPIEASGVPVEAESLAVVVEDPDAPSDEPFVHWLLWNVPAETTEIPEDVPKEETVDELDGAAQGTNDFDELGYDGPCPPESDNAHRYQFTVHAVEGTLSVEPGADLAALESALADHKIDEATAAAEYER